MEATESEAPAYKPSEHILAYVTEHGPTKVATISEQTGISKGLVSYHLNAMKSKKIVAHNTQAGTWALRKVGARALAAQAPLPGVEVEPTIQHKGVRTAGVPEAGSVGSQILDVLRERGPQTHAQLAAITGANPHSMGSALRRLRDFGLIVKPVTRNAPYAVADGTAPAPPVKRAYTRRTPEVLPPAPLARPGRAPMRSVGPNGYVARQVQSIILRMQNANESGQLFTDIDFNVLERLAVEAR